ncbi:unnamed protein product, partial [Owenia fusiformis]
MMFVRVFVFLLINCFTSTNGAKVQQRLKKINIGVETAENDMKQFLKEEHHHDVETVLQELQASVTNHQLFDITTKEEQLELIEYSKNKTCIDPPIFMNHTMSRKATKSRKKRLKGTNSMKHSRQKRNIVLNWDNKWEKNGKHAIIPWMWGGETTPAAKENVLRAMAYLHKHTCIRFVPYTQTVHKEHKLGHNSWLNFTHEGGCCWSFIGRLDLDEGEGQRIHPTSMTSKSINLPLHEFGHALGMSHEQKQPGREPYLKININNVLSNYGEFAVTENAVSYHMHDFHSLMHYSKWFNTRNELQTMEGFDPDWEYLFSNKRQFDFFDLMDINRGYQCDANCPSNIVCYNTGFAALVDDECSCICPAGLKGDCTQFDNADSTRFINLRDGFSSIFLTSPNYPESYPNDVTVYWFIKAPENSRVSVYIEDFDIGGEENNGDEDAGCDDYLEIRTSSIGQPGHKHCGTNFKRSWLTESNLLWMTLVTDDKGGGSGFKAKITFISDKSIMEYYNIADNGASYSGFMNFTQDFRQCINWERVKHCDVNPFSRSFYDNGLGDHNYCRNPNGALRPWCYTNEMCSQNFCDIGQYGLCHDIFDDCSFVLTNVQIHCQNEENQRGCRKTCGMCDISEQKKVDVLPPPFVNDSYAVQDDINHIRKNNYVVGDVVKYNCKKNGEYIFGYEERRAMSDGTWSGRSQFCGKCPSGWATLGDHCYKAFLELMNFDDAETFCQRFSTDGHLVSINSAKEQRFVEQIGNKLHSFWLGFTDNKNHYRYTWLDGSPSPFVMWFDYEPNDQQSPTGGEDCAVYSPYFFKGWYDRSCDSLFAYICKKPAEMGCKSGWRHNPANNACYRAYRSTVKWIAAEAYCNSMDANLVSILDQNEADWFEAYRSSISGLTYIWIGLNDRETEGEWIWSDGSYIGFLNWKLSEPNGHIASNCTQIKAINKGKWDDISCDYENSFICEATLPDVDVPCQDDPAKDCISILARMPDMCENQLEFAHAYCLYSCGFCNEYNHQDNTNYTFIFTPNNDNQVKLLNNVVPMEYFRFEVKTCKAASICLGATSNARPSEVYQIELGGGGNTKSFIAKGKHGARRVLMNTPNIVSCTQYRPFWVRATRKAQMLRIEVGTGLCIGENMFMTWTDPYSVAPYGSGFVSGSSYYSAPAFWKVYHTDIMLQTCGDPKHCWAQTDIPNCHIVSKSILKIGEYAEYSCDIGYGTDDSMRQACTRNGLVPREPPKCIPKSKLIEELGNLQIPRPYRMEVGNVTLENSRNLRINRSGEILEWKVW